MPTKDVVGKERRSATKHLRVVVGGHCIDLVNDGRDVECVPDSTEVRPRRCLVATDRHRVGIDEAKVDAVIACGLHDQRGTARDARAHRVEARAFDDVDTTLAEPFGQDRGHSLHPACDRGQTIGTVIDRIHRRGDGQQNLRRADVARRLLAANVLLARLQGQPVRRSTGSIDRYAHESTR